MSDKLDLSAPWIVWARKLEALFAMDDEVAVEYDAGAPSVTVRVSNAVKADALALLIPTEKQFGNVTLAVSVVPCNDELTEEQVFALAFAGNPALVGTEIDALPDGSPVTFALFAPECAQYFADDLTNPRGLQTLTLEQVAREVLDTGSVIVTSDAIER